MILTAYFLTNHRLRRLDTGNKDEVLPFLHSQTGKGSVVTYEI